MSTKGNVKVISRFRPMNELEKSNGNEEVAEFTSETSLTFNSIRENHRIRFNFDRIFPPNSTQEELYNFGVKEIIDGVLDGYNGTVLAYGQTSSGKTYTMEGLIDDDIKMGVIPRMINHVFNFIRNNKDIEFIMKASMVELYQERIRDLIDTKRVNLNIRETPSRVIYIENLSEYYVYCENDILNILKIGRENRAQASTKMNEHSSRSHSIFMITINQKNNKEGNAKTGKLYLVDLAGSERMAKTGATGKTLEEGKIINKSLTILGIVINRLTDGKSNYIPYRDSKLTRVLQESLGGNSKTCLIITCSPSVFNESETLSTLRFGERAKKIRNKAKINKEFTVMELQRIIDGLKEKLKNANERIVQLEKFIKNNGLVVPMSDYKVDDEEKKDEDELNSNLDVNNIIKIDEEEEKLINENKDKFDDDIKNINENLINVINEMQEKNFSSKKDDLIQNLINIKKKIELKDIENQKKIKDLKEELENVTKLKDKLQLKFISEENNNPFKNLNEFHENYFEFVEKIEKKAINKKDKELITICNEFKNQYLAQINIEENKFENKEIQTETYQTEIDLIKEKYENEKRILFKTLDEKNENYLEMENKFTDLKEKYQNIVVEINDDQKKLIEKNNILQDNLKQLKNKLIFSQTQKSMIETKYEQINKLLIDRNKKIEQLEKEKTEIIEKNDLRSTISFNVIKVIKGGMPLIN